MCGWSITLRSVPHVRIWLSSGWYFTHLKKLDCDILLFLTYLCISHTHKKTHTQTNVWATWSQKMMIWQRDPHQVRIMILFIHIYIYVIQNVFTIWRTQRFHPYLSLFFHWKISMNLKSSACGVSWFTYADINPHIFPEPQSSSWGLNHIMTKELDIWSIIYIINHNYDLKLSLVSKRRRTRKRNVSVTLQMFVHYSLLLWYSSLMNSFL